MFAGSNSSILKMEHKSFGLSIVLGSCRRTSNDLRAWRRTASESETKVTSKPLEARLTLSCRARDETRNTESIPRSSGVSVGWNGAGKQNELSLRVPSMTDTVQHTKLVICCCHQQYRPGLKTHMKNRTRNVLFFLWGMSAGSPPGRVVCFLPEEEAQVGRR